MAHAKPVATKSGKAKKKKRRDLSINLREADNGWTVSINEYSSFDADEKTHIATDLDSAVAWIKKNIQA